MSDRESSLGGTPREEASARGRPDEAILRVTDLVKRFPARRGAGERAAGFIRAVDGVSFEIRRGETLGLVGESGCGKSTLARAILRLTEPTSGTVRFDGRDLADLSGRELRALRRDLQVIFQDPFGSLDPRMTVGETIAEGLEIHRLGTASERAERVREALRSCGLDPSCARRYPHEFSGGERQRIGIARAIVLRPELIVCDEPVSSLDVSVRGQIIDLLLELKERFALTYLFIAHDLAAVEEVSDRVLVMYLGKIVESARREDLFARPRHPYTQALLAAARGRAGTSATSFSAGVPSASDLPPGCSFHPRCALAVDVCRRVEPEEFEHEAGSVRCHVVEEEERKEGERKKKEEGRRKKR